MCSSCGCIKRCGDCEHFRERMVVLKTRPAHNCVKCKIIVKPGSKPCLYGRPVKPEAPANDTKPLF